MRVLTDEPFVPDPGSIFHMQEIIVMIIILLLWLLSFDKDEDEFNGDNAPHDDELHDGDVSKNFP